MSKSKRKKPKLRAIMRPLPPHHPQSLENPALAPAWQALAQAIGRSFADACLAAGISREDGEAMLRDHPETVINLILTAKPGETGE